MMDISVDKQFVLSSHHTGDASLPPQPQQHSKPCNQCDKNTQQTAETTTESNTKENKVHNICEQKPEEHENDKVSSQAIPDSSTQNQNGTQLPKPQQRLNKRRSTMNSGFKHPFFGKRRRRTNSDSESVLPTNFLLGGNIFDPLNLNSLLDEEVNRALNAETPKSSPLPAKSRDPVEILIARDITDPLNLKCCTPGDGGLLLTPLKSTRSGRRRHRKRHHGGVAGLGVRSEGTVTQLDLTVCEKDKTCSSQTELTLASSTPQLDSVASEVTEETMELVSNSDFQTFEAQYLGGPSNTGGQEETKERPACLLDSENVAAGPPASHRQRKRRRTTSKSENFGTTYRDTTKMYGPGSGLGSQPEHTHTQGASLQAQQHHPNHRQHQQNQQKPNQQKQKKKFQYGNYDKYYGYRNPGATEDSRLRTFKPEWFQGKEVLDLGCNSGHLTLTIARNWRPSRIVGMDIDGSLIHAAKQNIRHYLSEVQVLKARSGKESERTKEKKQEEAKESTTKVRKMDDDSEEVNKPRVTSETEGSMEKMHESECLLEEEGKERGQSEMKMEEELTQQANSKETEDRRAGTVRKAELGNEGEKGEETEKRDVMKMDEEKVVSTSSSYGNHLFPVSLRIIRGPIAAPPLPEPHTHTQPLGNFPANVTFVKGNYVLNSDMLLLTQHEEFDVILCLSVTKWVHLNWGDEGLKRLFQRVYRHLRPGGLFILEPQPWHSYSKRKKLTETITKNYYSIRLKPDQFSSYLTSEVGFCSYELIGTPNNLSRGFQRPVYVFHKGPAPPN